jgi:hypothetical protein
MGMGDDRSSPPIVPKSFWYDSRFAQIYIRKARQDLNPGLSIAFEDVRFRQLFKCPFLDLRLFLLYSFGRGGNTPETCPSHPPGAITKLSARIQIAGTRKIIPYAIPLGGRYSVFVLADL